MGAGPTWIGYSRDVLEADPTGRAQPPAVLGADERRPDAQPHDHYSYMIPNVLPDTPVNKWILGRLAGVECHEVSERYGDAAGLHHPGVPSVDPTVGNFGNDMPATSTDDYFGTTSGRP
jgi:hypothetical protein